MRATVLLRHMITTCAHNHQRLARIGCERPVENLERLFVGLFGRKGHHVCKQAYVAAGSTVVDEPSYSRQYHLCAENNELCRHNILVAI